MVDAGVHPEDFEPAGPGELLELLAGPGEQAASIDPDLGSEIAGRLGDHLELVVEYDAPAAPGDRTQWLLVIERLETARRAARRLGGTGVAWAAVAAAELDRWLEPLSGVLAGLDDAWELGSLVERRAAKHEPGMLPWSRLAGRIGKDAVGDAPPARVIRAWAERRLGAEAAGWLAERVREEGPWREAYREHLASRSALVRFVRYPLALEHEPFFYLRLLHLGEGARLTAHVVENGTSWRWPGREPVEVPEGLEEAVLAGDEATGSLRIGLEPIEPSPLQVARRLAERAAEVAGAYEVDERATEELAEVMAGELHEQKAWRAALERAGETYQRGLELEDDEERELEDWVRCALEARLELDRAAFRTVNRPALRVLRRLDEALAGMRNAVILLDSEEYNEILAGQEPPPGAWWAARLELEAAVPEEEVSRALVEMGEERARGGLLGRFMRWLRERQEKFQERVRLRPTGLPVPSPAYVTGSTTDMLAAKHEKRIDFEALDTSWKASMRIGKKGQAEVNLMFSRVPENASTAILVGVARTIEREPDATPKSRFLLAEVLRGWQDKDMPTIVVVMKDNGDERFSPGRITNPVDRVRG